MINTQESKDSQNEFEGSLFDSDESDGETQHVGHQKIPFIKRVNDIFHVYLKMMMGRNITDHDHNTLAAYMDDHPNKHKMKYKQADTNHPASKHADTNLSASNSGYVNEFDYHLGDLIISFPNPDHPEIELDEINAMEAIELCKNAFCSTAINDFELMDNLITLKAIEQTFYMLDRKFKYHQKRREMGLPDDEVEEQEVPSPSQSSNTPSQSIKLRAKTRKSYRKSPKSSAQVLRRSGGENDPLSQAVVTMANKLIGLEKMDSRAKSQALKEAMQIDYKKLKREKTRIRFRGYYFLPGQEDQPGWRRSKYDTGDFTTLIRNIVMLQLSKQGFVMRNFMSTNGKTIFCVLYQNDENLKILAEKFEIAKKLNFQFSDLFSLEPVDSNLRPYRLSNRLWRHEEYTSEQISPYFLYMRPRLVELIQSINYKLVAREINLSQLNQQLFNPGSSDLMHDEVGPTDEQWRVYYEYLMFVNERVTVARQQFRFNNDDALLLNRQKTAYELYLKRNKHLKKEIEAINENDLEYILSTQGQRSINQRQGDQHTEHLQKIGYLQQEYRKSQEKFKEVRSFLHLKPTKPIGTKQIKVCKREKLAYGYLKIFQDAMGIVNIKKRVLNTIWDEIGIDPFEQYVTYTMTRARQAFSQRNRLNAVWAKYQICETGKTSIFSTMERIKLINMATSEHINFNTLLSNDLVQQVFCCNDEYELRGISHKVLFNDLFEKKFELDSLVKEYKYFYLHKQVKEYLSQIKEAKSPANQLVKLNRNVYYQKEFTFVESKMFDLQFEWRFRIACPWFVPTQQIREYYGEKIALYFTYLGYYTQMLLPIGLLGLGVNIYQIYIWDNYSPYYVIPGMLFCWVQIQWSNLMFDLWQSYEKVFAVKYGQLGDTSTSVSSARADFKGEYVRSPENDQMNAMQYPDLKRIIKVSTTISLQVLILIAYSAVMIGIFILSETLYNRYKLSDPSSRVKDLGIEVTAPALINLLLILVCDELYDEVSENLTDYENHETIEDYENSYIFKKYFLCTFSLIGPLVEIMFVHELVGLTCVKHDCYRHAQYHFSTIFLMQFSLNIWEIIKPEIQILVRKLKRQEEAESNFFNHNQSRTQIDDSEDSLNLIARQAIDLESENEISQHPFKMINAYIEAESQKESYVVTPEHYGTVDDYMEIILQYTMLCLFGTTFPMCFFVAFLWNVLELQTDKLKLMQYMQRPLPMGEKSIGVWNGVLEILSLWSLLQNSGLISYLSQRMNQDGFGLGTLAFFLLILLLNFFFYFFELTVFGDISYGLQTLMKRHVYILKSTVERFRAASVAQEGDGSNKYQFSRFPLYKIFGCVLSEEYQKTQEVDFEELSSDSEIEDHYIYTQDDVATKQKQTRKLSSKQNVANLIRHNHERKSDWALKFKFENPKDPVVQQKEKIFQEKTLNYLRKVEYLTQHKKNWSEDRLNERHLFLRRRQVLLRNLDWRKVIILKEDQEALRPTFEAKMRIKYADKLRIIKQNPELEQNKLDLEEIMENSLKYIDKHMWLATRKVIYLRVQGVWFHQFRKSSKKKGAFKTVKNYRKLLDRFRAIERNVFKSDSKATKPYDEQFKALFKHKSQAKILRFGFKDLIHGLRKIAPELPAKYTLPLSSRQPSMLEIHVDDLKTLGIRRTCRFGGELGYYHRLLCEEMAYSLYLAQLRSPQSMDSLLNKKDTLQLLKLLEERQVKSKTKISIYANPDTYRWLVHFGMAKDEITPKSLSVLYFTEINFSQHLYTQILHRVCRFYCGWGDQKNASLNMGLHVPLLKYFHLAPANSITQVDDVFCKGYLARAYSLRQGHFLLGKTLRDIINERARIQMRYTDNELFDFLSCSIKTLESLEVQHGMFHGGITPQMFHVIGGVDSEASSYALLDIGMFYWYDPDRGDTLFLRNFSENSQMLYFSSPELIHNYLNPNRQTMMVPFKADLYSLGMVCLEIMTLGQMSAQLPILIEKFEGNIATAVEYWINENRSAFETEYPSCYSFVMQMTYTQSAMRPFPSSIAKTFGLYQYLDKQISVVLFPLGQYYAKLQQFIKELEFDATKRVGHHVKHNLHGINMLFRLNVLHQAYDQLRAFIEFCMEHVLVGYGYGSFFDLLTAYANDKFDKSISKPDELGVVFDLLTVVQLEIQLNFAHSILSLNLKPIIVELMDSLSQHTLSFILGEQQHHPGENTKNLKYLMHLHQRIARQSTIFTMLFTMQEYVSQDFETAAVTATNLITILLKQIQETVDKLPIQVPQIQVEAQKSDALVSLANSRKSNAPQSQQPLGKAVTQGLVHTIAVYLSIKCMRLQIMVDRDDQSISQDYQSLKAKVEAVVGKTHHRVKSIPSSPTNSDIFVDLMQKCDFSSLPINVRVNLNMQADHLSSTVLWTHFKHRISKFEVDDIDLRPFLAKILIKQRLCLLMETLQNSFKTLIREVYLLREEDDSHMLRQQLSYLYIQHRFFQNHQFTCDVQVAKDMIWSQLVHLHQTFSFLKGHHLQELVSQLVDIFSKSNDESAHFAMFIAYELRLVAQQYRPVITVASSRVDYLKENLQHPQSTIQQLKKYAQKLGITRATHVVDDKQSIYCSQWHQSPSLLFLSYSFRTRAIYYFSSIHPENVILSQRESVFKNMLENKYVFQRDKLSYIHRNRYVDLQMSISAIWLSLMFGKPDSSLVPYTMDTYEQALKENGKVGNLHYQLACYTQLLYVSLMCAYYTGQRWREFMKSPVMVWLNTLPCANPTTFLTSLIYFLFDIQQINLASSFIGFLESNPQTKLVHSEMSPNWRELHLLKALCHNFLRNHADKETKTPFRPELFLQQYHKHPLQYILGAESELTFEECVAIEKLMSVPDKQKIPLISFQLAIKLLGQLLSTSQFDKAYRFGIELEGAIFEKAFWIISQGILRSEQGRMYHQVNLEREMPLQTTLKFLNLGVVGEQRYEYVVMRHIQDYTRLTETTSLDFIELIRFQGLFIMLQAMLIMIRAMKGEISQAQEHYSFVSDFYGKLGTMLDFAITNFTHQFLVARFDLDKAESQQRRLLQMLQHYENFETINLTISNFNRSFKFENPNPVFLYLFPKKDIQTQSSALKSQSSRIRSEPEQGVVEDFNVADLHLDFVAEEIDYVCRPVCSLNDFSSYCYLGLVSCYIRDTSKLQKSVQIMFMTQDMIQTKHGSNSIRYAHALRLLAEMYVAFINENKLKALSQELGTNCTKKIRALIGDRQKLIRNFLEQRVYNKETIESKVLFRDKLALMEGQLTVLRNVSTGVHKETVLKWAIRAANDSIALYQQYCEIYQQSTQPQMALVEMILSDSFINQNKVLLAKDHIDQATNILSQSYSQIDHPDYVQLFTKQGLLRQKILKSLQYLIKILLGLKNIESSTTYSIIRELILENREILKYFDDFNVLGIDYYLEQKLKRYDVQRINQATLRDEIRKDENKRALITGIEQVKEKLLRLRLNAPTVPDILKSALQTIPQKKGEIDFVGLGMLNKV